MTLNRSAEDDATKAAARPFVRGLLFKFLSILAPVFLAAAAPGIWFLIDHQMREHQENLAARIGNHAALAAAGLMRYGAGGSSDAARDLIATLAVEPAFRCAEVLVGPERRVLISQPPVVGCKGVSGGHELILPVGEDDRRVLRILYGDDAVSGGERLVRSIALSVVALAFLLALLAAAIGFRMIIGRPIGMLLASIRHATRTGHRQPVDLRRNDELGTVIDAFNEMVDRETTREEALRRANDLLRTSQSELRALNDTLETRIRERTARLEEKTLEAEAASRAKSEFLANMSHELRTPLNGVIGFLEIMDKEMQGPIGNPDYAEYVRHANQAGHHLLSLINDVLDLSKIEAGKDEMSFEQVDVSEAVAHCTGMLEGRARDEEIEIVVALDGDLPDLTADPRKLRQILLNLLSNAIKFTPRGGRVTVRAWGEFDRGLVVEVADTGIGIAPEDIATAMSPFGQIDGTLSRKYEGTGLGLPLSKAFVEQHGGTLELRSEPGTGTTVTLRFPKERIAGDKRSPANRAA